MDLISVGMLSHKLVHVDLLTKHGLGGPSSAFLDDSSIHLHSWQLILVTLRSQLQNDMSE